MSAAAVAPGWLSGDIDDALCTRIARLTADAYGQGDPRPGLPVPDGAYERAEDVRARLQAGARYLLITDGFSAGAGDPIAAACVLERPGGALFLERVVTAPRARGRNLVATTLDAVERQGRLSGADRLVLNAVVERCLPAFYTRHGFRPCRWLRAADKPLSEIEMVRPLGPSRIDPVVIPDGPWLVWVERGDRVQARPIATLGPADVVVGLDVRTDRPDRLIDPQPATDVAFLMPRVCDPAALTWWRWPPGHGIPAARLRSGSIPLPRPGGPR
jgi:hypothetical protein